ncbi:MAG TPA: hypothetical protein DHV55_00725 [Clostridiaceae bacterium]|nr:hypothetical protein [Clostridiaceae bacterium]
MDHALDNLMPYVELYFSMFIDDWKTGKYEKYSDCPGYDGLKALVDAANKILKYMDEDTLKIRKMIEKEVM